MSLTHRGMWLVLAAVVAGCGVLVAVAELADVYLKTGLKLRGDVTETATEVVVRNELGEARFPREQVERIEWLAEAEAPPAPAPASAPTSQAASRPTSVPLSGAETAPAGRAGLPAPPLLSAVDIQRLKMYELRVDGAAEKVRVRFAGKDQYELPRRILAEWSQQRDFRKEWEDILLRGQPYEKLQLIVRLTRTKYADRITIVDDPGVFATFQSQVLPQVVKGCARAGCHTGDGAARFRFPSGQAHAEAYAFTIFALLDRMETPEGRMLDRDAPDNSLLLGYLLPQRDNPRAHPPVGGKPRFAPVLRKDSPAYERVREWIGSLTTPHPQYELDYEFPSGLRSAGKNAGGNDGPALASQPATRPAREP